MREDRERDEERKDDQVQIKEFWARTAMA